MEGNALRWNAKQKPAALQELPTVIAMERATGFEPANTSLGSQYSRI